MNLLLSFILLSLPLHAETFKIAGTFQTFDLKDGLLLQGCEKSCEALETIKKHPSINLKEARAGQIRPNSIGSDVCTLVYKVSFLTGVAQNQDQRTFCVFKDKSIVETNSLGTYLTTKKFIQK